MITRILTFVRNVLAARARAQAVAREERRIASKVAPVNRAFPVDGRVVSIRSLRADASGDTWTELRVQPRRRLSLMGSEVYLRVYVLDAALPAAVKAIRAGTVNIGSYVRVYGDLRNSPSRQIVMYAQSVAAA